MRTTTAFTLACAIALVALSGCYPVGGRRWNTAETGRVPVTTAQSVAEGPRHLQ